METETNFFLNWEQTIKNGKRIIKPGNWKYNQKNLKMERSLKAFKVVD